LEQPFQLDQSIVPDKKISLPLSFTELLRAKEGKPEPTLKETTERSIKFPSESTDSLEAHEWLSKFTQSEQEERITFSSHFSAKASNSTPSLIELLLLLMDSVNTPAIVEQSRSCHLSRPTGLCIG